MPIVSRHVVLSITACLTLATFGCASTQPTSSLSEGSEATVNGIIASIDTQPWTYDGNAVVLLDTATLGQVSVQLPARWNLCKAPPVDVGSLVVGQRAKAVGTVTAEGELLVCEHAEHRLMPAD